MDILMLYTKSHGGEDRPMAAFWMNSIGLSSH
jgi:hypothetical protein